MAAALQLPLAPSIVFTVSHNSLSLNQKLPFSKSNINVNINTVVCNSGSKLHLSHSRTRSSGRFVVLVGKEETELRVTEENDEDEPSPEDLEFVAQIKRVLELLRKNRDMLFSEVKLTIMIEDLREVERKRLLGIEDPDGPTREDLAEALEEIIEEGNDPSLFTQKKKGIIPVNEGKVPKDPVALRLLAEEMIQWPNLEVEAPKKKSSKSLYAKVTDTGIDPEVAAKRLNVDWDSAAEIEDSDISDEAELPPAVGYGALYLVTAFPVIIVSEVMMLPEATKTAQEQDEVCNDLHEVNLLAIDDPGFQVKKESPEKEKQISVDPISLREPSFNLMLPAVITSPRDTTVPLPPILPPAKARFISCSLPNSATSSPRFISILSKKKWKNESQASPRQVDNLVRQHSTTHSRFFLVQDSMFARSKSCGEGRASAPTDELDLFLQRPNASAYNKMPHGSFSNKDMVHKTGDENADPPDEEFKCSALCLFLPGFGKAKPVRVRPRKEEVVMENVISRTVSLEKFECGSWASSAIIHDHDEDGDSMNLYFDLPLELIRNSVNDAHTPINAAFVFEKDEKGVLKNGSSSARASGRKSHESSRQVRFSVSSSTSYPASPASCITPRLRKAREEFNAFLEAQSA